MIVVSQITEVLCDTCYEVVLDSGYQGGKDDEVVGIARAIGNLPEFQDHQCEQRTGGLFKFERCVCACDKEPIRPFVPRAAAIEATVYGLASMQTWQQGKEAME